MVDSLPPTLSGVCINVSNGAALMCRIEKRADGRAEITQSELKQIILFQGEHVVAQAKVTNRKHLHLALDSRQPASARAACRSVETPAETS